MLTGATDEEKQALQPTMDVAAVAPDSCGPGPATGNNSYGATTSSVYTPGQQYPVGSVPAAPGGGQFYTAGGGETQQAVYGMPVQQQRGNNPYPLAWWLLRRYAPMTGLIGVVESIL